MIFDVPTSAIEKCDTLSQSLPRLRMAAYSVYPQTGAKTEQKIGKARLRA
jgi:hypothetical protein